MNLFISEIDPSNYNCSVFMLFGNGSQLVKLVPDRVIVVFLVFRRSRRFQFPIFQIECGYMSELQSLPKMVYLAFRTVLKFRHEIILHSRNKVRITSNLCSCAVSA